MEKTNKAARAKNIAEWLKIKRGAAVGALKELEEKGGDWDWLENFIAHCTAGAQGKEICDQCLTRCLSRYREKRGEEG